MTNTPRKGRSLAQRGPTTLRGDLLPTRTQQIIIIGGSRV